MARGSKARGNTNQGNYPGQAIDLNGLVNLVVQTMQTQNLLQQQLANLQTHNNAITQILNGGGLKNLW